MNSEASITVHYQARIYEDIDGDWWAEITKKDTGEYVRSICRGNRDAAVKDAQSWAKNAQRSRAGDEVIDL